MHTTQIMGTSTVYVCTVFSWSILFGDRDREQFAPHTQNIETENGIGIGGDNDDDDDGSDQRGQIESL